MCIYMLIGILVGWLELELELELEKIARKNGPFYILNRYVSFSKQLSFFTTYIFSANSNN